MGMPILDNRLVHFGRSAAPKLLLRGSPAACPPSTHGRVALLCDRANSLEWNDRGTDQIKVISLTGVAAYTTVSKLGPKQQAGIDHELLISLPMEAIL